MTTVMIAMVLNEEDIIEGWVRHHADEVDHLLVADNLSTDNTRPILEKLVAEGLPLTVVDDPDPAFRQSEKMSALSARAAAELDATWIVPADIDEIWVQSVDRLRVVLPELDYPIAAADLYNHVRTNDDVDDPDPFRSMVWRLEKPQRPLGKVAFRYAPGAVIWQGNHGVTLPTGEAGGLQVMEIRHFKARSEDQFERRGREGAEAVAAAPELHETSGAHWRSYGRLTAEGRRAAFREHWFYRSPADVGRVRGDGVGLVRDPAPYRRWELPPETPLSA